MQRRVIGFLYDGAFEVPDLVAALFYAGDLVRIAAWLPLFALYALGRTRLLIVGEFLSLPLFALLLWALGDRLTLVGAGVAWVSAYVVYAAFNAVALLRASRKLQDRGSPARLFRRSELAGGRHSGHVPQRLKDSD
jgi:O-antigen/teichoic acid export membrane protein